MHPGTKDAAHQKYNSITYASQSVALLLVMLLVELQNTCKKGWTEKKIQYMLYFWKDEGSRMSNMTFPFNSAADHSTFAHNAKKSLNVIISGEIPEN